LRGPIAPIMVHEALTRISEKRRTMKGPEEFCRSYGEATLDKTGREIARHYVYPFVSFTLGHVNTFTDRAHAEVGCRRQIARYEHAGIGNDIRLKDFEIVQVCETSALCTLTWELFPTNGLPSFSWSNIYGYRRNTESEGFEFTIADNQILALTARVPDFFTL